MFILQCFSALVYFRSTILVLLSLSFTLLGLCLFRVLQPSGLCLTSCPDITLLYFTRFMFIFALYNLQACVSPILLFVFLICYCFTYSGSSKLHSSLFSPHCFCLNITLLYFTRFMFIFLFYNVKIVIPYIFFPFPICFPYLLICLFTRSVCSVPLQLCLPKLYRQIVPVGLIFQNCASKCTSGFFLDYYYVTTIILNPKIVPRNTPVGSSWTLILIPVLF